MPRKARLDAEGTLQHVMARGIERRSIFKDDNDRELFLERLGNRPLMATLPADPFHFRSERNEHSKSRSWVACR